MKTCKQRNHSKKLLSAMPGSFDSIKGIDNPYYLGKEKATHFSILAWEIPWTGEPGSLEAMSGVAKEYNMTQRLYKNKNKLCYQGNMMKFTFRNKVGRKQAIAEKFFYFYFIFIFK